MSKHPPLRVAIIGSGLAGSCLANGLLRHNIDFQSYDRLEEGSKREGYQIRLGGAALHGLRTCLSPEHLASIVQKFGRASGLKAQAPVICSRKFQELLDLSKFSSYGKSAPINRVILRDALCAPLKDAGRMHQNKVFSRYEIIAPQTSNEHVRVWFEDESFCDCDILIAADGAHSKVNKQVGLENLRQIENYTSLLAKSELPTAQFLDLPPKLVLNPVLAFSDNKAMYFCAYLPEKAGESGKYDESLSSMFFGLQLPNEDCPSDLKSLSPSQQWDVVSHVLRDWAPEYHTIIGLLRHCEPYISHGSYSIQPSTQWRQRVQSPLSPEKGNARIWLMGDAVHAMLPNRGMGGNTALRDAATILPLLQRLSDQASPGGRPSTQNIENALNEYEAEMIPRAFAWVRKSGGGNAVPIDTNTMFGLALIRLGAILLSLLGWLNDIANLFRSSRVTDDAPELK